MYFYTNIFIFVHHQSRNHLHLHVSYHVPVNYKYRPACSTNLLPLHLSTVDIRRTAFVYF